MEIVNWLARSVRFQINFTLFGISFWALFGCRRLHFFRGNPTYSEWLNYVHAREEWRPSIKWNTLLKLIRRQSRCHANADNPGSCFYQNQILMPSHQPAATDNHHVLGRILKLFTLLKCTTEKYTHNPLYAKKENTVFVGINHITPLIMRIRSLLLGSQELEINFVGKKEFICGIGRKNKVKLASKYRTFEDCSFQFARSCSVPDS